MYALLHQPTQECHIFIIPHTPEAVPTCIVQSIFTFPFTSNFCQGLVVPIQTLPLVAAVNMSVLLALNTKPLCHSQLLDVAILLNHQELGSSKKPVSVLSFTSIFQTTSNLLQGFEVPIQTFPPSNTAECQLPLVST